MNILLKNQMLAAQEILGRNPQSVDELSDLNRAIAKQYGQSMLSNAQLLQAYRAMLADGSLRAADGLERVLRKRAIRTMSGIAPVAVLTKPFACPGKCAYCPTEKDVPQSYLSNEPAVMRAIRCEYDPYVQVSDRLRALVANGHNPTKIELIVIGGTWSVLPKKYKYWYMANCFAAANDFAGVPSARRHDEKLSLKHSLASLQDRLRKEQLRNERAKYQMIGVTLETRPDYINEAELIEMRTFGCTRVELGVQAIDDQILELNRRGHGVQAIAESTAWLRAFGFKITYHLMPGLPGSTASKDLKMFEQLFSDERFQPDQIKFYPTVVTKGSLLYKWWQQGKYRPYSNQVLQQLIIDCKNLVPRYVRIIRLIRDIPSESIVAGNIITNLRQVMQQRGVKCSCIRCRESREAAVKDPELKITQYAASAGQELFLEFCSQHGKLLYGFCRLRLPGRSRPGVLPGSNLLKGCAIIRELHIYGELVSVGMEGLTQHAGLGKRLLAKAEQIAKQEGYQKLAVISGVGVRNYYRKNGYRLHGTYMIKSL